MSDEHDSDEIPIVEVPIDGELDLHNFHPGDIRELVPDYIGECLAQGIFEVRIIHGKGKGTLRRTVHAALERTPAVASFATAPAERGGWGATIAILHRDDEPTQKGNG